MTAYVPVLHMITRPATTSNSAEYWTQENSRVEQLIGLQSETTTGPGHNKSGTTYNPVHNTRLNQNHDHLESTYNIPGFNQSETLSIAEHGHSGTASNLVYQNKTTQGIFAVSEEQKERQLRMETKCQNLNSSVLQKLVIILSSTLKFSL